MDASFWVGKRPPGVRNHIDLTRFRSVADMLDHSVRKFRDLPAFTCLGHSLSYQKLDKLAGAFAAYLQRFTDLTPGDRIAVQMPNCLQYPVVVLGVFRAGLVLVNTNPLYTARELLHQFKDSGAKALVYMDVCGEHLAEVLPQTEIAYVFRSSMGDLLPPVKGWMVNAGLRYIKRCSWTGVHEGELSLKKAIARGRRHGWKHNQLADADAVVMLQYTGGTTGVAKAAMLSNRNLVANVLQVRCLYGEEDERGRVLRAGEGDTVIAPLPLYHIYSFTVNLLSTLFAGVHSVLIPDPRDTRAFIKAMQPWPFSDVSGLNTLFVALLDNKEFESLDFSALVRTTSGGAALNQDTSERWRSITGVAIGQGYGLTECSPVVCASPSGKGILHGSVGVPLPDTALKVIDVEGSELALGQAGELCVRGPQVMVGYWQQQEATAAVLDDEGWLRTGDVGVIQENGHVYIVDRLKDMILVSGFNVYPNEIEDVATSHHAVRIAAAIGVADEKSGERVRLYVVKTSEELNEDRLMAYLQERLTAYKLPREIIFRPSLPQNSIGKILRKELRRELNEAG